MTTPTSHSTPRLRLVSDNSVAGVARAHPAGRSRTGRGLCALFAAHERARLPSTVDDDEWVHEAWSGSSALRRAARLRHDACSRLRRVREQTPARRAAARRRRLAGSRRLRRLLATEARAAGERGAVTAEYVVLIVAAVAFAGLLVAILRSGEVRAMLLELVQNALGSAG